MDLDFFIEVGCEEIPAGFLASTLEQLDHGFTSVLAEHSLSFRLLETFATPRRLIVHIGGLASAQPPRTETITGPPYAAAFNTDHSATRAAEGFAKKHSIRIDQLQRIQTDRGEYLGFVQEIRGLSAHELLCRDVPEILARLDFPKKMKWEESEFLFARPIRWILCLLDRTVLPIEVAGVAASNFTFGHRILTRDSRLQVDSFQYYTSALTKNHIIFDPAVRKRTIESELNQVAGTVGGHVVRDEPLLLSVMFLSEHPSVVAGDFDARYLELPREVLITVMREHQKYFSVEDGQGNLLPKFLAVVDSDLSHHISIGQGHQRVVKARLADASFFWTVDRRITLEARVDNLRHIVLQAKLGTLYQKVKRLGVLTRHIAKTVKRSDLIPNLERASRLCKSDLTTEMVKEFTNLQGIVGGLYAKAQGLPEPVASAICDHYRPLSLEDDSPRNLEGAVLSIADKFDSIVAAFAIGLVPTGSRDPLALRRQALGIIKVLLDKRLSFSLSNVSRKTYTLLKKHAERSFDEVWSDLRLFLRDRIRFVFSESGYRYDEVNAILEVDFDNPLDCLDRLKAIAQMRQSQDFSALATSFKRIKNIISKAGLSPAGPFSMDVSLFRQEQETMLHQKIELLRPRIRKAKKSHNYLEVFELLASARPDVDLFFDKVLVMDEDPAVRSNRLSLLGTLLTLFMNIADISEIVAA